MELVSGLVIISFVLYFAYAFMQSHADDKIKAMWSDIEILRENVRKELMAENDRDALYFIYAQGDHYIYKKLIAFSGKNPIKDFDAATQFLVQNGRAIKAVADAQRLSK